MKKRRARLLIKKHHRSLHRLHCYGKDYTGKDTLATSASRKDALLHDWNCQIKHTVGEVSKQVFTKKMTKHFLMEMIDRLFTEKTLSFLDV